MPKKSTFLFTLTLVFAVIVLLTPIGALAGKPPKDPPPSEEPPPWTGCPEDFPPVSCEINHPGGILKVEVQGPEPAVCGSSPCYKWTYTATGDTNRHNQAYLMYPVCCSEDEPGGIVLGDLGEKFIPPGEGVPNYFFGQGVYSHRLLEITPNWGENDFIFYTSTGGSKTSSAGMKSGDGFFYCFPGIKAPDCEECEVKAGKLDTRAKSDTAEFEHVLTRLTRNDDGCAIKLEYCKQPDPYNPNECAVDWLPADSATPPTFDGVTIQDCGNTWAEVGVETCIDECRFVVANNPGWLVYKFYGQWYKVCGGETVQPANTTWCCDPDTNQCCTYSGTCVPRSDIY